MSELLLRQHTWNEVTPESAGWRYLYFTVRAGSFVAQTDQLEIALVPLSGSCRVTSGDGSWEIGGRANVFAGMPWALYLPRESTYRVEGNAEVAICGARCERRREPILVRPEDVEIEVRGAGNATRQINHIIKPDFPAERLLVVEVLTPAGNWSSYPPHKHDEDNPPDEVVLEETYYFRTEGFALQRLYSPPHGLDLTETVYDGDVVLVPYGYHTTAAAHGYPLYYLNALAGDRRSMAAADDPALHWTRAAWANLEPDPRVPLVR
jgi:5-deoxy-glucuronate isomerase